MQVEEQPDIDAFREQVADLKNIDLFANQKVQDLLQKALEQTRYFSAPAPSWRRRPH